MDKPPVIGVLPPAGTKATPYHGLQRHRLVVAGCFGLAAAIVGISAIDLRPLIEQKATIDKGFHVQYTKDKPILGPNLAYEMDSGGMQFPYAGSQSDNGLIPVVELTWEGKRKGFVDADGKVKIKPQFGEVGTFHEGLALAKRAKVGKNNKIDTKWGFIDPTGKFVIQPQFDDATSFRNGSAAVASNKLTGLIDKNGKLLVKYPENRKAEWQPGSHVPFRTPGDIPKRFGPGYLVAREGHQGLIDSAGNWLVRPIYDNIEFLNSNTVNSGTHLDNDPDSEQADDLYFKIQKKGRIGVIDRTGKIVFPAKFDGTDVTSFANGHATIAVGGKYGFADSTGNIVIAPKYQFATAFGETIAVKEGGKWHLINSKGETLPGASEIDGVIFDHQGNWMHDGLGAIIKDNLVGFVDKSGKIVIPARFDYAEPFSEGLSAIFQDRYWRFINKQGQFVSPKFGSVSDFHNGAAEAYVPGPLYGLVQGQSIDRDTSTMNSAKHKFNDPAKANEYNARTGESYDSGDADQTNSDEDAEEPVRSDE